MSAPALPASLARWSQLLGAFDAELATALGPLVRGLDALLAPLDDVAAADGERDGWDGVTRRGDPDRLLASEWLLASEVPDEFLRRAAMSELWHLAPAYRDTRPRGRLACLVDCGPDQLGAPRLVQLAALVALARRAEAAGTTLGVGVLGEGPVRWLDGPFADVARAWLAARTAVPSSPAVVQALLAGDDGGNGTRTPDLDPERTWVLCGPELAARLPARARTLVAAPGEWDEHGMRTVSAQAGGRRVLLPLPPAPVAIRALRGAGFAGTPSPPAAAVIARSLLRFPHFPAAGRAVLARGADASTLATFTVDPKNSPRVRIRGFSAPVVAATVLGRRTIALLRAGADLVVEVVGRPLYGLHGLVVAGGAALLETPADADAPLDPLVLEDDALLWRHGTRWWRLTAGAVAHPDDVVGVGWTASDSSPRVVRRSHTSGDLPDDARSAAFLLLGARRTAAWSADGRTWTLHPAAARVELEAGEVALGLAWIRRESRLVTVSAGGLIVRTRGVGADATRALTRWSGEARHRAVHPTHPWLLLHHRDVVEVVDLDSDTTLAAAVRTVP